jgi:hypothetical protein
VRRDAPPSLVTAVRRAMSETPGQRFTNVAEFSAGLIGPARPRVLWPSEEPEDDEVHHAAPPRRSRRRLLVGVTAAVVIAVAAGVWLASSMGSSSRAAAEDEMASAPELALPPPPPAEVVPEHVRTAPDVPAAPSAPARGRVVVNSMPWAELYVDGKLVGNTPVVDLPLSPGPHRLRLLRAGFKPHEEIVRVVAGQTLRITSIVLQQESAP